MGGVSWLARARVLRSQVEAERPISSLNLRIRAPISDASESRVRDFVASSTIHIERHRHIRKPNHPSMSDPPGTAFLGPEPPADTKQPSKLYKKDSEAHGGGCESNELWQP